MSNETEIAYSTTESFLVRMERISFLVGAIEVLGNAVHNREILRGYDEATVGYAITATAEAGQNEVAAIMNGQTNED